MKKKKTKLIWVLLLVCLLVGSYIYLGSYSEASKASVKDAKTGTLSDSNDVLFFGPEDAEIAIVFYPGGKVQTEAYATLCKALGDSGIYCGLVEMPFYLAVLNPSAADDVIEVIKEKTSCTSIYIAGHSLGGAMACQYASKNSDKIDGLILLAAYSAVDLSGTELRILSLYGSEDGVMNRERYEKALGNYPSDFTEKILEGGCHSYFGDYGMQKGDGVPAISREEQVALCVETILRWIK